MFYIARNSLAVTLPMTKKAALELWNAADKTPAEIDEARWQLCREEYDKLNPTVVMELN